MKTCFEAGLLQTRPQPDFASAIDEAIALAEQAVEDGAEFLMLPEYCGGLRSEGAMLAPPTATESEHPVLAALREFAHSRKTWILVGSVAIEGPDGKFFNRGFVIDGCGEIRSSYDKIHLFDVELSPSEIYHESARVHPGSRAGLVPTVFGRIGFTICYELRFPGLYRELAQAGADFLVAPAAFTKKTGEMHWHILNRSRAIENGCYVLSPCSTGPVPGGGACFGHSLAVDPWGRVIGDGGIGPGVVRAHVDLNLVADARRRIPSLKHDRAYESPSREIRSAA
ncbi:MAG: carbon-nitrogen hydrolase family protein [Albidovulum sp.]|nr:carbon-nitrogen hydrolase family protein [Albidovulum sp.]